MEQDLNQVQNKQPEQQTEKENPFVSDYLKLKNSIGTITKNTQGFGYTYLDLVKLLDVVEPRIEECNFILVSTVRRTDSIIKRSDSAVVVAKDKDGKPLLTTRREYETPCYEVHSELIHTKTGQILSCDLPLYVDDIDPQALGSAITYMRRYSLFVILGIKTQDDDGANCSARDKTKVSMKEPLPDNPNEIATFLSRQDKPSAWYGDLLARKNEIDEKLYKQITSTIMFPPKQQ